MSIPAAPRKDDVRPATDVIVRCTDISHTFGSGPTAVVAVSQVTCEVREDSRLAIMGPSGSGKSTLLHIMAGLESITGGTVSWPALDGTPQGSPSSVGVVFQGPSLIASLDALENVTFPLVLQGITDAEAERRALDALETLGLGWLSARLPDELSGGQAQRIAVVRVLAAGPRLILADEPTGQLDRETGSHVIDVLIEAADRLGAALVITTHDPEVAGRLSERWLMHDGELRTTPHYDSEGARP